MCKIGNMLAALLEILAMVGAYAVHYFTRKKMGMARYVIYKNQGWESIYPMETIKWMPVSVILIISLLIVVIFWTTRKKAAKQITVMILGMSALSALYIGYTVFNSTETMRAYYFISLLLAIAAVIQIVMTAINIRRWTGVQNRNYTDEK